MAVINLEPEFKHLISHLALMYYSSGDVQDFFDLNEDDDDELIEIFEKVTGTEYSTHNAEKFLELHTHGLHNYGIVINVASCMIELIAGIQTIEGIIEEQIKEETDDTGETSHP